MITLELTYPMAMVLGFLAQRKIERALTPRPSEIAVALGLDRPEVTAAIEQLLAAELIEINPRNSRAITLTPAALHLAHSSGLLEQRTPAFC